MVVEPFRSSSTLEVTDMKDEDIVADARAGDSFALEYLIDKYRSLVYGKARTYFLIGADREDIVQEGMIGLYKAIRDYKGDKLSSFKTFAEICVTRQMITAIKTATRQKHIPLNSYISLNKPVHEEESERTLLEVVEGQQITDPMEVCISKELVDSMESTILEVLTDLDLEVFNHYMEGKS